MAWSNAGPQTSLEPGHSVDWWYAFGSAGNEDIGMQIAGPNVFAAPGALGTLVASNQGKIILGIGQAQYVVTITNTSSTERAIHNLQGGGVT
jgi:hypothetical protein